METKFLLSASTLAVLSALAAQVAFAATPTIATGDSRTVSQPSVPSCAAAQTLSAQFSSNNRASPTGDDTTRVQNALTGVAGTGKAICLVASGSNNAFYVGNLTASGAGLVIGKGVTVYGLQSYATANAPLITFSGSNSFLMGLGTAGSDQGTIDGRGDILAGSSTSRLVQAKNISNFIVYNVTLKESIFPNLYVEGGSGFTAWGVTIRTPATRKNADGIDIDSLTNASVINSSVEAGDDGVAIKTNTGDISNVTVKNSHFYGTHGLSVGSIYANNVSNILFDSNWVSGTDLLGNVTSNPNGMDIKTGPSCALTVKNVSFLNTCMKGVKHVIMFDTNYAACKTGSPSGTPTVTGVVVNGATSISSLGSAYTLFDGRDASHILEAYLANVSLDSAVGGNSSDQFATIHEYNVTGVTASGTNVSTPKDFTLSGTVPACSSSSF
ncbi:glycosyl hydrolase family 28 protein [Uliginosibacterium gangwonense]|uniref:glycosyl hydrolase family 28 protein n=1 Tax=Uliginosibacterium gangwonense TaxID=392736 RepID=UPI00036090D5|nr:glycosyl hydrolase family 28 protein [Uliginosibacterium gangwonense]